MLAPVDPYSSSVLCAPLQGGCLTQVLVQDLQPSLHDIRIVKIDIDKHPQLATKYRVQVTRPTPLSQALLACPAAQFVQQCCDQLPGLA